MLIALAASRDRQRRLVADAGHELRTPLTSLRTNLDLLTQADGATGARPSPPEARAELLDDIRAQIEELTTLIGDLTELARDEPLAAGGRAGRPRRGRRPRRASGYAAARRASPSTSHAEPWWVVGEAAGARARGHQPARQRRQVEPARRHRHGPAAATAC